MCDIVLTRGSSPEPRDSTDRNAWLLAAATSHTLGDTRRPVVPKPPDLSPADDQAGRRAARDAAERTLDASLRAVPTRYVFQHPDAMRAVVAALSGLVDLLRAEGLNASRSLIAVKEQLDRHPSLSVRDYDLAVTHSIARYFAQIPAAEASSLIGRRERRNTSD